jgi:hypothetical protein
VSAQNKQNDSILNQKINDKLKVLEGLKSTIQTEERAFLKLEVEAINQRFEKGEITASESEKLKKEAAKKRALNIENRLAIIDSEIMLLRRNGLQEGNSDSRYTFRIGSDEDAESGDSFIYFGNKSQDKPRRYDRRTTNNIVFAIGFNNAIIEGENLEDSPYKLGGSGFVELGYAWKTRVFKNSNVLRVKYGASLQWNKLDIKNNQFLVNNNGAISLEPFEANADKVKFRTTNLVFPIHFEFGPSKKIERDTYFRYSTRKQFKFGIGAYGGFNIGTLQKIKFENVRGDDVKDKFKDSYNTSDLIYGISSYVAFGGAAVYLKYDLNPIFKDQTIDQNNISVGLRFDMD